MRTITVLSLTLLSVISLHVVPSQSQECPNIDMLKYMAAKEVYEFFAGEAKAVEELIRTVIQAKITAKQALDACYIEYKEAEELKEKRMRHVSILASKMQRMEAERHASRHAFDEALKALKAAQQPQSTLQQKAIEARRIADEALKMANERSREAGHKWADANAAQQSARWVPPTKTNAGALKGDRHHPNPIFGPSPQGYTGGKVPPQTSGADASKLTEIAKAAEFAAAVAEAEAKRLNDLAVAAEEEARKERTVLNPSWRSYNEAKAKFEAVNNAYAQYKVKYDVALISVNEGTNLVYAKEQALKDAKARLKAEAAKIKQLQQQLAAAQAIATYAKSLAEMNKPSTTSSQATSTTTQMSTTATMTTPSTTAVTVASILGIQNSNRPQSQPLNRAAIMRQIVAKSRENTPQGRLLAMYMPQISRAVMRLPRQKRSSA